MGQVIYLFCYWDYWISIPEHEIYPWVPILELHLVVRVGHVALMKHSSGLKACLCSGAKDLLRAQILKQVVLVVNLLFYDVMFKQTQPKFISQDYL